MKIGILQCGRAPQELQSKYGDYDTMFQKLLGPDSFEYQTWAVLDNDLPQTINDADGWLITGSKFGAYEDHEWIPPLEQFLRDAFAKDVPIIGICFGHQILAQALGGKVEKFAGGWSVGHVNYKLEGTDEPAGVHAFHQDQVVELPDAAESFGSTDFCKHAFISYGDKAMSMQPHPEFSDEFLQDLVAARGEILPEHIREAARSNHGKPLTTQLIGQQMADFFRQRS